MRKIIRGALRKIKSCIKKCMYCFKYNQYKKMCLKNNQKEFLIFNTPLHGNLGDHAIILAEYELLKKAKIDVFEIPTYEEKYCFECIKKNISSDSIISITGGGFIGSQWLVEMDLVNKVIENFNKNKIIIFPQTIYFEENEIGKEELAKSIKIFNGAKNLNIFTREKKSYDFAKKNYEKANVFLVPDVVLSLSDDQIESRDKVLMCFRQDKERIMTKENQEIIMNVISDFSENVETIDTVVNYDINPKNRKKELDKILKKFSGAKLVITDRLHGMIFSAITGTPCIAFNNCSKKVEGVYEWIKKLNYIALVEDINDLPSVVKRILTVENPKYNMTEIQNHYQIFFDELKG